MWRSSTFSTTMTWNWRGSSSTLMPASSKSASHWSKAKGRAASARSRRLTSGCAMARAKRSPGPLNSPQVTKMPTARKARTLTTDSAAMAATMPSWRSVLSRWRVPKAIVKPASTSATIRAMIGVPCPAAPAPAPVSTS